MDIYIDAILSKINLPIHQRVMLAISYLHTTISKNISVAVGKEMNDAGHIVVTQRSLPGEYPRADTTELLKTLFWEVTTFSEIQTHNTVSEGFVGTPLDYGLILETNTNLDRRFLLRTFNEELPVVMGILTGPLKG